MGTIPAPNIAGDALAISQAPQNAFAEYQRAAALQQQTQQARAMAPLQQQEAQQQIESGALQLAQQKAMNQAYQDAFKPDANGNMVLDPEALQQSLAKAGHGAAIPAVMEGITKYQTAKATLQEQQQKLQTGTQDALGNLGYALQQANYDPQLAHTIIQDHLNDPNLTPQGKQQLMQEQQAITQNPALVKQIADQWVAQSPSQQSKAIERQKAQAETMKDRYKEVNGSLYDVSGDQAKLITPQGADPAAWQQLVDQVVPPNGANASLNGRTKAAVGFYLQQGNIKAAQDEIKSAGQQIGSIEKDIAVATNPQVQQGKIDVSKAEGAARAAQEAEAARGSNAELARVPPHLVTQATQAADKADADYAQSKSVSDRLTAMMDAAKKGNVVSYQLIPEEGALQVTTSQGVHRINMAEIQNYGGGSLWQRMQGHIGKQLTGESIPASVLDDMSEMQKIQANGSRTKYENTLKSINQRTGATFKPVEMEGITNQEAPANTVADPFAAFGGKKR